MNYEGELLKGSTDSLLLHLISSEPMYGYQIIKELERRSNGFFQFKEGTLYPALHRLEKAGLVRARWQRLPEAKERRYYYITDKGLGVLDERLAQWRGFSSALNRVIRSPQTELGM